MAKWVVKTMDEVWTAEAPTAKDAIKVAWNDRMPKSIGFIVEIREASKPESETSYAAGESAMKWAGFEMEED